MSATHMVYVGGEYDPRDGGGIVYHGWDLFMVGDDSEGLSLVEQGLLTTEMLHLITMLHMMPRYHNVEAMRAVEGPIVISEDEVNDCLSHLNRYFRADPTRFTFEALHVLVISDIGASSIKIDPWSEYVNANHAALSSALDNLQHLTSPASGLGGSGSVRSHAPMLGTHPYTFPMLARKWRRP
jgi:hypothetical protein